MFRSMSEPKRCVSYDHHDNAPNECCGCHYECGDYPEHRVHTDPSDAKYHVYVPPKGAGIDGLAVDEP